MACILNGYISLCHMIVL